MLKKHLKAPLQCLEEKLMSDSNSSSEAKMKLESIYSSSNVLGKPKEI